MAVLHRVNPDVRFDDAVPERPADAAWRVRFRGAVMQHSVFRRLWLGALASSVGQWMQQVALGWLAIVMTNSPGFVGIVTFSAGLPFLVVAPFGGALIDRIDRRRLMLDCQVLAFLLATVLAVDVISGFVQAWHLPIAAFLNGSLLGLLIPTQQSLVPALVPRESLTNAVALMSAGSEHDPRRRSLGGWNRDRHDRRRPDLPCPGGGHRRLLHPGTGDRPATPSAARRGREGHLRRNSACRLSPRSAVIVSPGFDPYLLRLPLSSGS